jgi:hypothetical protein
MILFPPLFLFFSDDHGGEINHDQTLYQQLRDVFGPFKRIYAIAILIGAVFAPPNLAWVGVFAHLTFPLLIAVDLLPLGVDTLLLSPDRIAGAVLGSIALWFIVDPRSSTSPAGVGGPQELIRAAAEGFALPLDLTRNGKRVGLGLRSDLSIGVIGETGSGKTNTMELFASQMHPKKPVLAFDYKGRDYAEFFAQTDRDVHVLSVRGSNVVWNIFAECDREEDLDEIAKMLFGQGDNYFQTAARQVFAGCCKVVWRDAERAGATPDNAALRQFFESTTGEEAYESLDGYDDLTPAAQHLNPESEKQASGVWAEVQSTVLDVFIGDFAAEVGDDQTSWSMTRSMRSTDGRAVVIDYDSRRGESAEPVYKLLLDLAARECLTDPNQIQYMILDEFAALPKLDRIERLVNAGRSQGVLAFFGLQSLGQLISTYGTNEAYSLIAGMPQLIFHSPGDDKTVELIQDSVGEKREWVESYSEKEGDDLKTVSKRQEDRIPITEQQLNNMQTGDAVVVASDWWRLGRVAESTPELRDRLEQVAMMTWGTDDE